MQGEDWGGRRGGATQALRSLHAGHLAEEAKAPTTEETRVAKI